MFGEKNVWKVIGPYKGNLVMIIGIPVEQPAEKSLQKSVSP